MFIPSKKDTSVLEIIIDTKKYVNPLAISILIILLFADAMSKQAQAER